MDFTIKVDNDLKIIRYRHFGIVNKEEIGKAWQQLLLLKEFTEHSYHLLSDYRDATYELTLEDVSLITDFLFSLKHILSHKKQSLIIDDPNGTAFSILFEDSVYEKIGFRVKVFSSEEAAISWLI